MECGIGELLYRLREETEFTQLQLCQGICSVSQLTRMEHNQLEPDHFQLDRLFSRMGKSTELLEYVLPIEVYELYELQYLIQTNICYHDWGEAEHLLNHYEQKKQAKKPIHRQYIAQERAQIAWIQGKEAEQILPELDQAIELTMPLEDAVKSGMALSAEELKLLLFRWEICYGTVHERNAEEIREILTYIEHKKMESAEKVRVYPYAVLLMGMICDRKRETDLLSALTREALSLLREEGRLLYLPEIMAQYIELLECCHGDTEFIETLRRERESLLAVEEEFQISFEKYRLFQHWIRSFELDCELVRKTRIAVGIAQETLCDGICTQETLSRIETEKRSPSNRNLYHLLKRMDRKRERIGTVITTDEYAVLEMKKEIAGEIQRFEYDRAEKLLEEIEKRLDTSILENEQYISAEKIRIKYQKKLLDSEQCVEQLEKILCITLSWKREKDIPYKLTPTENNILNQIATIYYENGKKEKAIQILKTQIKNMEESRVKCAFCIREWGLALGNLATAFEETHQVLNAMEACRKRIQISIEAGKGNGIGRSLVTLACALEQKEVNSGRDYLLHGASLLKLYKMNKRYELVKAYINSPAFKNKK